jgi:hypothetical protein
LHTLVEVFYHFEGTVKLLEFDVWVDALVPGEGQEIFSQFSLVLAVCLPLFEEETLEDTFEVKVRKRERMVRARDTCASAPTLVWRLIWVLC